MSFLELFAFGLGSSYCTPSEELRYGVVKTLIFISVVYVAYLKINQETYKYHLDGKKKPSWFMIILGSIVVYWLLAFIAAIFVLNLCRSQITFFPFEFGDVYARYTSLGNQVLIGTVIIVIRYFLVRFLVRRPYQTQKFSGGKYDTESNKLSVRVKGETIYYDTPPSFMASLLFRKIEISNIKEGFVGELFFSADKQIEKITVHPSKHKSPPAEQS